MLKNSKNNPNIYIEFMVLGIVLLTQLIFKIILCSRDNDCFHLQIRKLRHIKIKKFTQDYCYYIMLPPRDMLAITFKGDRMLKDWEMSKKWGREDARNGKRERESCLSPGVCWSEEWRFEG